MKKVILTFMMLLLMLTLSAITLEESIQIARENNKEILAEESGMKSADWSAKNALTNFFPKAYFSSTIVRIDDDTYDMANAPIQIPEFGMEFPVMFPVYKTSYTNSIMIQQPIFNGGKMILGYQLAKLAKKQSFLTLQDKRNDISYMVASTYFGILKLQDLRILSEKSLNSTGANLEKVQKNYEVGTAKKSDVLQWQVKKKNDETAINEIDGNIDELFGMWTNLLGVEGETPSKIEVKELDTEISEYASLDAVETEKSMNKYLSEVSRTSPTIKSLELARKMAKKNYLMAKGEFLPSINLQFNYEFESDDEFDFSGEENWNFAAAVSVPIFTSGANFSNMKAAKYEMKKTNYETESAKENYLVAAKNAFFSLITKSKTIEDNKTALEFAEENHKIINELYEQGMVTNSELLDAEAMLFGSEMKLVSSYYDYILIKYELKKYRN